MASEEQVVYLQDKLVTILSPKSPAVSEAVFGSAPRPRRPSTPKSPPSTLSTTASQTSTPAKKDKALPPVPGAKSPPRGDATPGRIRAGRRPDSPDVETMIARTPRPRRKSSATFTSPMLRGRVNSPMVVPTSWKGIGGKEKEKGKAGDDAESVISDYGMLLHDEDSDMERQLEGDGSESDSSIDIHTPLPHLMFRDGLLSPRSKLLPGGGNATLSMYLEDDGGDPQRANSVLSLASTADSTKTKSGIYRDPRDTHRRRQRHKDQTLLRAGMGLTTGLGWSDSEDEDAPSMLTRRLINTSIAKQPAPSAPISRAPSQLTKSTSVGNLSHPPPSYSPVSRPSPRALSRSTSASFSNHRLSTADTESLTSVEAAPVTRSRTQSNASASSVVSSGSRESSGPAQSVASSQASQSRTTGPRPLRLPRTTGMPAGGISRSTSVSESRPPVAGASKLPGARPQPHARTRTLSNPGSRLQGSSVLPRPASSKNIPPRSISVSAAVMAPIRSRSISTTSTSELSSRRSEDTISEFPLPPTSTSSPFVRGLVRPSVNTRVTQSATASPVSPPSATRVLNTVGTGPRPRIGTGMVYRNSSYSSMYETSRVSRASVASSGKEVGVM
ncbi:hypothetical protein C8Q79DRAFT_284928 [Trametes meyenii]|nr:hypothetical protein C8Q79DRAFT_284928 [Trametes meyenii]